MGIRKDKGHKSFLMFIFKSSAWSQIRSVLREIQ